MTKNQASQWVPFAWAGVAFLIIVTLMFNTAASAVLIWEHSSTFTHGFFILPIFLWLVWRKRELLATLPSRPDWLPVPLILVSGMFWLLAGLAGIQVGQHVALVMIIIFSFWAIVGREIAGALKFPLAFLFFLAPIGQELVPHLMEITADFTVYAIRLTGIPIYREGLFFSLPSGNWSVVEACSGIRYLIASMTLGTLYAYLNYDSTHRRLLFIALSAIVPIVANGIRAFMIVMIGHHSDMALATGVDHLVYGWLFFGVVMFVLFSLGALFAEPVKKTASFSRSEKADSTIRDISSVSTSAKLMPSTHNTKTICQAVSVTLVAVCVAIWPAWALAMNWSSETSTLDSRQLDAILAGSDQISPESLVAGSDPAVWSPQMSGYDVHLTASVTQPGLPVVKAHAFVYITQRQGKEMISASNVLVKSGDPVWRVISSSILNVGHESSSAQTIEQNVIESSRDTNLVWRWYLVSGSSTTSPVKAKLFEARDKLLFRHSLSITYLLVTDTEHTDAEEALAAAAASIQVPG